MNLRDSRNGYQRDLVNQGDLLNPVETGTGRFLGDLVNLTDLVKRVSQHNAYAQINEIAALSIMLGDSTFSFEITFQTEKWHCL